jgi:predicted nucleic-acid-binding Zn-ribbon protein
MKLVTARTFDSPIDAHMLNSKLESEGIFCYLKDEHTITIDPLVSNAICGIKLQIKEEDIDKTKAVLKEIDNTPYRDKENNIAKCPKCESTDLIAGYISMKGFSQKFSAIISVLFMIFPFHLKTLYKCKECGTEFKLK